MIFHQRILQFGARQSHYYLGANIFSAADILLPHLHGHQVLIVTQKNIAELYLAPLLNTLKSFHCDVLELPQGEQFKNLEQWQHILTTLLQHGHDRTTTLIALGGGMIGDITGFAAACYHRGVNYLQIPTTLIAQADAAIGGKTAVNHALGKNLIGAIHQPLAIIADSECLKTLSPREYIAGLAEIIKCGLIQDAEFFAWLEKNVMALLKRDTSALLHAIATSVAIKARLVEQDEHDLQVRKLLNFGHTFAHALETITDYQTYLHGEAVAIGMVYAARLSASLGMINAAEVERIMRLLTAMQLPTETNLVDIPALLPLMQNDKKTQAGKVNFVLLEKIGQATFNSVIS